MARLTKSLIDRTQPQATDLFLWDQETRGFGVRIKPSGVVSFLVQYRNADGVSKRKTVGRYGILTVDQARKEAKRLLAAATGGGDPASEAHYRRKGATVSELAQRYLDEHARTHKKPGPAKEDERILGYTILPALGSKKVSSLSRSDISRLHHSLHDRPYLANRVLALLSKMFALAEDWGLREDGSNPCRRVKKFKESKRERLLLCDELIRLGQELDRSEQANTMYPGIFLAIRLLALTGCRVGEILNLRWDDTDLSSQTIQLRDTKTGPRKVTIGAPAAALLATQERVGTYVVAGPDPDVPLSQSTLQLAWRRIRRRAGLPDVRLHDLRHLYGSVAGGAGYNGFIVRDLLGHRDIQTTSRYVHQNVDPLRQAADHVSSHIAAALQGNSSAEVIELVHAKET